MRPFDDDQPAWRRYLPQLTVLVVALLVVLALRARSDGDDPERATSTTEASTDQTAPSVEPTSTTATSAGPADGGSGQAGLPTVVLTVGDLPSGWTAAEPTGKAGELCDGEDPTAKVRAEATSQVAFRHGDEGPFLVNAVWQYRSERVAGDFVDAAADAIEGCASFDQGDYTFHMERIDLDDVGDEAVAAKVTGRGLLGEVDGRVYLVRVGDRVAAVLVQAIGRLDTRIALDALRTVAGRL